MQKQLKFFLQAGGFIIAASGVLALPMSVKAQEISSDDAVASDSLLSPDEGGDLDTVPEMPTDMGLEPVATDTDSPEEVSDGASSAQGEAFEEDLFFDAEALVPTSDLSRDGAPSKVDPVLNPGSRLVVSRKKANPGSREARMVAAERAMKLGRYESALEIFSELHASNKRDPNALMGRAVALQRLGRDEQAVGVYEELLELRPKNLAAQINMQGLLGKRFPAVALRNLLELRDEHPGNTSIVAQLSVVEAKMGRYADALRYLGVAASMEPENAGHVFNMAVIADRAGDKKQAIAFYEEALEIDTLYGSGRSIPREAVFERLAEIR